MDRDSLRVCRCVKALRGTGVELLAVLLLLEELALSEAAELPADPDNTLALPAPVEADERAEVELTPDEEMLLLARFNTEGVVLSDEPLLLEVGVSNELAVEAADAAPAPEEEPAVFDAPAATEPVWEDWIYRSCRLPGLS
jgi:hypothetical protein